MSRASALEGQLNKSEAALSTALSQNAALTSELADVNSLLAKVRTAFSVEIKIWCVCVHMYALAPTCCFFFGCLWVGRGFLQALD